ncbi:isocitrate/isopropylmalate dehydrogenase family protein [Rathayibacter toxicus]|uniref:Isocitrate/isopropylmalate dehydrogenase family protein n=1 Tax=Rathayibacter toxicus TaxID=145458 RepID=A0A0C5BQB2_9MICO|nr:isocitrate/isopropylmalate dehydrogenase family protein [Rathayibacter toxicus]AJM76832.1 hypothetical protein TI83_00300 [Rathayibacter toxicus]ALS57409.1 hypothetical protein APU90_06180 [Rathayibacter toxicus]KKM47056.1 hypothetical protein VT73_00855 [Rathayibacter toxicus]PPG24712.1 isocitrate/isopropylmalate dehydrogenase family protein [Rathayibacter toxicus]PPG48166.1 isocitrate/isopropylmalate dehydrogenase family protein [Rathayibacter toxicus]
MNNTKARSIAVLPGDGIGPEVISEALPVLNTVGIKLDLKFGEIGWKCWQEQANPVPEATWKIIRESDATLLGAITSKPAREAEEELPPQFRSNSLKYVSPVVQLRQKLSLTANYRPVFDLRRSLFDFVVIRENTEGLYSGIDEFPVSDALWPVISQHPNVVASSRHGVSVSIRLQTWTALSTVIEKGFILAKNRKKLLTIADKPNVLRQSSQLIREVVEKISTDYPEVDVEILNVDAVAMWMVTRPSRFDVIVAENMFGDILSDVGAGVMGGLGLAPSGNIGLQHAYFEPVHGSAPHMAGQGKANPMAMFLTIAALLDYLKETDKANLIRNAVQAVLRNGKILTYDLGGESSTSQVADAVLEAVTIGANK